MMDMGLIRLIAMSVAGWFFMILIICLTIWYIIVSLAQIIRRSKIYKKLTSRKYKIKKDMRLDEIIIERIEHMLSVLMDNKVILVKWKKEIIYYKYENNDEVKSIKFTTLQKMWRNR